MSDKQAQQAERYAQAVYQAVLEQWQSALDQVQAVLSKDPDLFAVLMDGSKGFDERAAALTAALPAGLPTEVVNLVKLLLQEGDLGLLPDVALALNRTVGGRQAPTKAEITSAVELSDKEKEALRGALTKQFGAQFGDLVFSFHVDAALMGGLRVRVGDRLIDTSIASRLATLRESLSSVVR
jgi:F-type H+-transporting ATPase subunit delta